MDAETTLPGCDMSRDIHVLSGTCIAGRLTAIEESIQASSEEFAKAAGVNSGRGHSGFAGNSARAITGTVFEVDGKPCEPVYDGA